MFVISKFSWLIANLFLILIFFLSLGLFNFQGEKSISDTNPTNNNQGLVEYFDAHFLKIPFSRLFLDNLTHPFAKKAFFGTF